MSYQPVRRTPWPFRAEHVYKAYSSGNVANRDISFSIEAGQVYGLVGPTGSGKSTLVKQIIGLQRPTSGRLLLGDYDLVADPDAARRLCSYLPQGPVPVDALRVRHAIAMAGKLRGGSKSMMDRRADELVDALDLGKWRDQLGMTLPTKVRRLVGFAMATVNPGALVILDEPASDLDPARRHMLRHEIRQLGQLGSAVLVATEDVAEAERSVDRMAILSEGSMVAEGTPASLKASPMTSPTTSPVTGTRVSGPTRELTRFAHDSHAA